MRFVLSLAIALTAAGAIAGCGGAEDVTQSESPAATTPVSSPAPTPTVATSATPTANPAPATETPNPAPAGTQTYTDVEHGFSVQYPTGWTFQQIDVDATLASHDVSGAVEFSPKGGLARASVYTYGNSSDLPLEGWILDHDALFFEDPPVDVTIAGLRGLLAPLNFDRRASPLAYLKSGLLVYGIRGATDEDFQVIVQEFELLDQ